LHVEFSYCEVVGLRRNPDVRIPRPEPNFSSPDTFYTPLQELTCKFSISLKHTAKMKFAVAATLVASAAAFAPSKAASKVSALKAFENELGAQPPLGFFDPLGLVADGDQEKFDRLRAVEIKHGRICQLGVVGYLTNKAGIYLPGEISYSEGIKFSDLGSGWDASSSVPVAGALQVLAFIGFLELFGWKQAEGSFPGDFSASPFPVGWVGEPDEEAKADLRAKELNQGRAAQMGMLALMVHDKLGNVDDLLPFIN
jgi:hypothetical protein